MDSNNKKRFGIAIALFTLIFGALSVFSIFNLSSDFPRDEEEVEKADYIVALEEKLNINLSGTDDFADFSQVGYEMLIVPTKFQYYIRPCFEFVIVKDGVVITNRLGKAFDDYNFKVGMKITKIGDQVLLGKTYFEILELIYAKNIDVVKEFTLSDDTVISYCYDNDNTNYSYDKETNTLTMYNLDKFTVRGMYELITGYENVTVDLSKANVTKYETIVNFLSLFSDSKEVLLTSPLNVIGQQNLKIANLKIVLKDTNNQSILFLATAIKAINSNIEFDRYNLNTSELYVEEIVAIGGYNIKLKDIKIINRNKKSNENSEDI